MAKGLDGRQRDKNGEIREKRERYRLKSYYGKKWGREQCKSIGQRAS
jgi:hypothetical protein